MIHIVLPAYNEEADLPPLLSKVSAVLENHSLPYQIILVNDGSTDQTLKIAEAFKDRIPLQIISHAVNRGLGRQSKRAWLRWSRKMKKG